MGKRAIEQAKNSKFGKKVSHTGNKGLVESLTNKGCMVTLKVREAQEKNKKC